MINESYVSIIVPVWNEERYLYECLESIKRQTYANFEVIIINDGSTDNSKYLIDNWCLSDSRFKAFHRDYNLGIGRSLNEGFSLATGDFQTWISADNWVEDSFLEELLKSLNDNISCVLAYSDWYQIDDNSITVQQTGPYYKSRLQRQCYIGPCWLFRRQAKEAVGPYCHDLCEDYYMHLLLSEQGDFAYVPKVLGAWRNHRNNSTSRLSIKSNWRESCVAKSKARWKSAAYKIAYVCPYLDSANVGWLLVNGINDLSKNFAARHILSFKTSMVGGYDLLIDDDIDEVKTVLDEADIIYVNNEFPEKSPKLNLVELLRKKPNILHVHGGSIGWNNNRIFEHQKLYNSKLLTCIPGHYFGKWVPNYMPVTDGPWPLTNSRFYEPSISRTYDYPLKLLCHHNYDTGKGIDLIKMAIHYIRGGAHGSKCPEFYSSVRYDLGMNLWEHLLLKQDYHVCVDQITHGYVGMAAWESMVQSTAVIARLDEITMGVYKDFFGEIPPIINCRLIDDIVMWIIKLANNIDLAKEYGRLNREWILKYYNANSLIKSYENVFWETLNGSVQ